VLEPAAGIFEDRAKVGDRKPWYDLPEEVE